MGKASASILAINTELNCEEESRNSHCPKEHGTRRMRPGQIRASFVELPFAQVWVDFF